MQTDINQLINSLGIQLNSINYVSIKKPSVVKNFQPHAIYLFLLEGTSLIINEKVYQKGETVLITGTKAVEIIFGDGNFPVIYKNEINISDPAIFNINSYDGKKNGIYIVELNVTINDSISFFRFLDKSVISVANHNKIIELIEETYYEGYQELIGFEKVLQANAERIVIELIRFLYINMDLETILQNNTLFLKDARLILILDYIKRNLKTDLSNLSISIAAQLSEEYVGQYFKVATGHNLQDFIEIKRLEKAIELLKNTTLPIHEISKRIGYHDPAYFSKRFRLKYNKTANQVRKQNIVSKYVQK